MVEKEMTTVINWIILLIGFVIISLGIVFVFFSGDVAEKFDNWFPDFGKGNISVNWDEDVFLEHADKIIIQYNDGKLSGDVWGFGIGDLYYNYDEDIGWRWSNDDGYDKNWRYVENEAHYLFDKLRDEDKEFIRSLKEKSVEEGLIMLVERMLKEDTSLVIRITGVWSENYDSGDKIVKNMDMFIDKLNQITRGGIKDG